MLRNSAIAFAFEYLWRAAFTVGTEWSQLDDIYEFKWNFTNLEEALKEGGKLYGKKVCLGLHRVKIRRMKKNNQNPDSSTPKENTINNTKKKRSMVIVVVWLWCCRNMDLRLFYFGEDL